MREKKTQFHFIFAWRRSGFPYTNISLDLFTGVSPPRDPTYQDASCHCPLTLDDHICSPIYRLSTQWPETVYTDYNVHTACQWEHLPDPSLFCIIKTPSKELWYTFKKTYPLALVNCYNYPCCSRRTISIVWGCNQGGIVAASMKQLSKSGEMFVTDKQVASISWPFCFSLIYNSSNSKISRASAFFWAAACLNRTLERMFQCSWNHRCLSGFPIWLHNLIKAHGTSWLFRLDPIHRKHIQEMKLRWEKSSRFH